MGNVPQETNEVLPGTESSSPPRRSPLGKAIDAAYKYHPFGFSCPQRYGEWVVGPTFAILAPDVPLLSPEEYGTEYFVQNNYWQMRFTKAITSKRWIKGVTIDTAGHAMERITITDRHGAPKEVGGTKCTGRAVSFGGGWAQELAYPLFNLARKVRPVEWRGEQTGFGLYGFNKEGALVVVVSPRSLGAQCRPGGGDV